MRLAHAAAVLPTLLGLGLLLLPLLPERHEAAPLTMHDARATSSSPSRPAPERPADAPSVRPLLPVIPQPSRTEPAGAPPSPELLAPPPELLAPPRSRSGARPESLAAVPRTAALERKLASLHPQEQEIADYKLGLLARLDRCLAGRLTGTGDVTLFFRFRVDSASGLAAGEDIDVRASSLPEADDAVFMDCARQVHRGSMMRMLDSPDDDIYLWGTSIHVPLVQDRVFAYLLDEDG